MKTDADSSLIDVTYHGVTPWPVEMVAKNPKEMRTIGLWNPIGSGIEIHIKTVFGMMLTQGFGYQWDALEAVAFLPVDGLSIETLPVNQIRHGGVSQGKAVLIGTADLQDVPTLVRPLVGITSSGSTGPVNAANIDLDGELIVTEGMIAIINGHGTEHEGIWGFVWREIPVVKGLEGD